MNLTVDGETEPLNIVIAGSEAFPFAKTGGLADVLGALPGALERLGHKPVVIIPAYRGIEKAGLPIEDLRLGFTVTIGNKQVGGGLLRGTLPGTQTPIFFIKNDDYYNRPGLYADQNQGYVDNCERFAFFSRGVIEAVRALDLHPDVVHCNDWHTGLLPVYLKAELRDDPRFRHTTSLMTIHNMEHQGVFWHWDMLLTGLDWSYFNWRQMEAYGQLNLLKSGLVFADAINTVSPRYAEEIQTPEFGYGLEGVLRARHADLSGIINGVDYRVWNPACDKFLPQPYDAATVGPGKAAAKALLQSQLGLEVRADVPLLGVIGRLVSQKGIDLIVDVLRDWSRTQDVQWAFLGGDGDPKLGEELARIAAANPHKVAVRIEKSEELAHRIEAASDLFLMPSRFEPCGLNQLYSLKYGTLPVVHAVGGLANTVVDASPENMRAGTATGFSFSGANAPRFEEVLARACALYRNDRGSWSRIQQTGMNQDWSWDRSARDYVDLYKRVITRSTQAETVGV